MILRSPRARKPAYYELDEAYVFTLDAVVPVILAPGEPVAWQAGVNWQPDRMEYYAQGAAGAPVKAAESKKFHLFRRRAALPPAPGLYTVYARAWLKLGYRDSAPQVVEVSDAARRYAAERGTLEAGLDEVVYNLTAMDGTPAADAASLEAGLAEVVYNYNIIDGTPAADGGYVDAGLAGVEYNLVVTDGTPAADGAALEAGLTDVVYNFTPVDGTPAADRASLEAGLMEVVYNLEE
jgi:hypothetical protein